MTERRYDDDEIAAIFRSAAEGPQTLPVHLPRDEGLTLADLQEIGREVGISPQAVAHAALSLAPPGQAYSQTFVGLPIGVGRTIPLNRRLTDEDWELLVVELRQVFGARGTLRSDGSLRQWTNGNLQALLEPTPTGHRLRLKTVKGDARASIGAGLATLGAGAAVAIAAAAGAQLSHAVPGIVLLAVLGAGMLANGALRLPNWARLRRRQMEAIATSLALPPASPPGTELGPQGR